MTTNKANGRREGLDDLRAASCILVLLYHYTTRYALSVGTAGPWPLDVSWGCCAVNTFFLLTGCLCVSQAQKSGIGHALRFLGSRFFRLFPTYWVCMLITTAVMALLMPERLVSARSFVLNLTMVPNLLHAEYVDGAYWTMPVELIFTFWVTLLIAIPRKRKMALPACLYLWMAAILACRLCVLKGIDHTVLRLAGPLLLSDSRGEFFAAGMLIGLLKGEKSPKRMAAALPLLALCLLNAYLDQGLTDGVLWMLASGGLIYVIKNVRDIRLPSFLHTALAWVAGISYPLYLLHQYIGFALIRALQKAGLTSQLWILPAAAVVMLTAWAVHRLVELPAAKLGKRITG